MNATENIRKAYTPHEVVLRARQAQLKAATAEEASQVQDLLIEAASVAEPFRRGTAISTREEFFST